MRILLVSDPPMVPSGYGEQVSLLVPRLQAAGHSVLVYGLTYHGQALDFNGVNVVGGNGDLSGQLMELYANRFRADIILTLKDPYVFNIGVMASLKTPWLAWVPLDTEPMAAYVKKYTAWMLTPLAMSQNGMSLMAEQGLHSVYAPPLLDTDFWTPGDRREARARLGLPADVFIAAFVGANQTNPSRKSIDQIILAWQQFIETTPGQDEAILFLHTDLSDNRGGLFIEGMLAALNLSEQNWRACDQLPYMSGTITREYVRDLYRAADVLLNPAMGGGFELCQAEAQACGTPVISCAWTAMRETNWSGWQVDTRNGGELFWTELGGFRFRPDRRSIVKCLRMALEKRGEPYIAEAARRGALAYNADAVMTKHWLPMLAETEALLNDGFLMPDSSAP